jgi:hypothetical protein
MIMSGVQFAMTPGTTEMPEWLVCSWDYPVQVSSGKYRILKRAGASFGKNNNTFSMFTRINMPTCHFSLLTAWEKPSYIST